MGAVRIKPSQWSTVHQLSSGAETNTALRHFDQSFQLIYRSSSHNIVWIKREICTDQSDLWHGLLWCIHQLSFWRHPFTDTMIHFSKPDEDHLHLGWLYFWVSYSFTYVLFSYDEFSVGSVTSLGWTPLCVREEQAVDRFKPEDIMKQYVEILETDCVYLVCTCVPVYRVGSSANENAPPTRTTFLLFSNPP